MIVMPQWKANSLRLNKLQERQIENMKRLESLSSLFSFSMLLILFSKVIYVFVL